ncbi:MAG: AI-2E family transporter [Pseudomonadota bacterium]
MDRGLERAGFILVVAGAIGILLAHLVLPVLAGTVAYLAVWTSARWLDRHARHPAHRFVFLVLVGALVVTLLTTGAILLVSHLFGGQDHAVLLLQKLADALAELRRSLPESVRDFVPVEPEAIRQQATHHLKQHAGELGDLGRRALHHFVQFLIGMVIGVLAAVRSSRPEPGPLLVYLGARFSNYLMAFRRVVFSQAKISALNTTFTALYLLVLLPLAGVHLPLTSTLLVVTFLVGLLPVVGNLVSNTIIVLVSLTLSLQVAIASLLFLVVIHKLEYFLNARIIGGEVGAAAWELLIAMLVMESLFGLGGLVMAPLLYAWLKAELRQAALI